MSRRVRLLAVPAVLAAGIALAAPPRARASEAEPVLGIPPYAPPAGVEGGDLAAWCLDLSESGRAIAGRREGGDMLLAAGLHLKDRLARPVEAARILEEAAGAYPPGDPFEAVAWLGAAAAWGTAGHPEAMDRALGRADAAAGARRPSGLAPPESTRWSLAAEELRKRAPVLRVDADEAMGRLASAADRLEALALDRALLAATPWAERPDDLWDRAARLRHRAGETERALETMERARAAARDVERRAERSFWLLFAQHGCLTPTADVGVFTTWPGAGFVDDVVDVTRALAGNPHAWRFLLSAASGALASDHPAEAVDLYLLALRDPAVFEGARGRPTRLGGLLAGFPAAVGLGRLEDAEWMLDVVERIGGVPPAEMAGYREHLRERTAERDARERAADAGAGSDPPSRRDAASASRERPLLRPPSAAPADRPAESPGTGDPPEGARWTSAVLAGAVAFLALLLLLNRRSRR